MLRFVCGPAVASFCGRIALIFGCFLLQGGCGKLRVFASKTGSMARITRNSLTCCRGSFVFSMVLSASHICGQRFEASKLRKTTTVEQVGRPFCRAQVSSPGSLEHPVGRGERTSPSLALVLTDLMSDAAFE